MRTLTHSRRARFVVGREEGNVILAVLVIVVGSIAVVGLLASVASGLGQVRRDQSRADAFQFANAGIDHALYRVDTKTLPTSATGSYVPTRDADGIVTGFTESLILDGVSYELVVTQDPPGQDTVWKVSSVGTDPTGVRRQAIADIEATRLFENGFFTLNQFVITGTQFRNIPVAYDSGSCPAALTSCELQLPVPGRLGTNDLFEGSAATLESLVEQWSGFNMYGRSTIESAREHCFDNACHTETVTVGGETFTGQVFNIPEALEIEVPPVPAGARACPNGGMLGSAGVVTLLAPGDYNCLNLNLAGEIVVSPAGTVRIWIDRKLSAARGTVVNKEQRPVGFQLYQAESVDGLPYDGEICGSQIWGLLYTPSLEIRCSGTHQPTIYGAVVANLHVGAGNHFKFHWDVSTRDALNNGKYNVRSWRECPVGTTDC